MSLSTSISVVQGATGATITGGAAVTFEYDSTQNGKKILVDSSNSDPATRKKLITDVTIGKAPVNGGLAKLHRQNITVHLPFKDAAAVVYPLPANFNLAYHPEMSAAQRETHFWNVVTICIDAELASLRNLINN